MSEAGATSGPDLGQGVEASSLEEDAPLLGHVGEDAVMLVRHGGDLYATGATCTHYGGPLAEGLVAGGTVRCPWHHACFDLASGESVGGPGLGAIACYDVVREGTRVKVGARREALRRQAPAAGGSSGVPASVLILGAGAAGTVCAETLRREGYAGRVTLVGAQAGDPVDRPNLSKDYLAGTAPEEWMPLRTAEALRGEDVDFVAEDAATAIDIAARTVRLDSGRVIEWGRGALVLATGAEPVRLAIDGANLPHVHVLRSLGDARAIIAAAASAKRAVVIGASFIGLEVAASLKKRGLAVTVVAPDSLPLARILGDDVGRFVLDVHQANGVEFRLGTKPTAITATEVRLSDGTALPAELVVTGVGVRPRTALAVAAGLRVEDGIVVDDHLRASVPDVYAAGDVARFPYDGELVRIEHWAVAERHAQSIARTLVGRGRPYRDVPFFWSQHHDVSLSYVGHAARFERVTLYGDLAARDAAVVYRSGDRAKAVLTVGRDHLSLEVERALELRDVSKLEALVAG